MFFSLLKHYLDTDTAQKVSQSVYCFTTSIPHGVENYFPRLWGTGISDAIFCFYPTALKGCRGIFFHPWCLDGWVGGRPGWRAAGNSLSGLYLRNRKV